MDPIEIRIRILVEEGGRVTASIGDEKEIYSETSANPGEVKIDFECRRYAVKVGKKDAGTCKGCTVQCHMKGKYKVP